MSNAIYKRGTRKRTVFKWTASLVFGLPAASISLVLRIAWGLPAGGGDGMLPVLMTVAHVSAMVTVAIVYAEAASEAFDILWLLKCRMHTLRAMKYTDSDEEQAALLAGTIALDLRAAEDCIAWAKLRE